jgi:hypothetical protein
MTHSEAKADETGAVAAETFIADWIDREGGQERANYGLFLIGL